MNGRIIERVLIVVLAIAAVVSTALVIKMKTADDNKAAEAAPVAAVTDEHPPAPRQDLDNLGRRGALEVIRTRTSVREYVNRTVTADMLQKLVEAGMAAPTAGNRQPWYFVVVTNRETLKQLAGSNEHAAMLASAGAAIVVAGAPDEGLRGPAGEMWVQDCSAATENILLAAEALGLGAVWLGVYPVQERIDDVRAKIGMPAQYTPLSIVSLGWPANRQRPKDKFKPEKIFQDAWGSPFTIVNPHGNAATGIANAAEVSPGDAPTPPAGNQMIPPDPNRNPMQDTVGFVPPAGGNVPSPASPAMVPPPAGTTPPVGSPAILTPPPRGQMPSGLGTPSTVPVTAPPPVDPRPAVVTNAPRAPAPQPSDDETGIQTTTGM